jgi:hypothetical protein
MVSWNLPVQRQYVVARLVAHYSELGMVGYDGTSSTRHNFYGRHLTSIAERARCA